MCKIGKAFVFVLILAAISNLSLVMVKPANAQTDSPTPSSSSAPAPFVPVFSLKYVPSSYSKTINTTNPYTGARAVNTNYYVNNTIEIDILNQAFNPNALGNGSTLNLLYSVRAKPHFSDYPLSIDYPATFPSSSSQYTVLILGFTGDNGSSSEGTIETDTPIPNSGQIDFQVEAIVGFYGTVPYHPFGNPSITMGTTQQFFETANSGWSNYLPITIASRSTSASVSSTSLYLTLSPTITSTSNPTPAVSELSGLTIVLLLLSLFFVAVVLKASKKPVKKS